jgi:hypothetical protein
MGEGCESKLGRTSRRIPRRWRTARYRSGRNRRSSGCRRRSRTSGRTWRPRSPTCTCGRWPAAWCRHFRRPRRPDPATATTPAPRSARPLRSGVRAAPTRQPLLPRAQPGRRPRTSASSAAVSASDRFERWTAPAGSRRPRVEFAYRDTLPLPARTAATGIVQISTPVSFRTWKPAPARRVARSMGRQSTMCGK